jgi:sec-independent protein translocase protein TatA
MGRAKSTYGACFCKRRGLGSPLNGRRSLQNRAALLLQRVGPMGGLSLWHWLVVGVIVLLLFGRGKISELMGDVAQGIKAFKKGLAEDDSPKNDHQIESGKAETAKVDSTAKVS